MVYSFKMQAFILSFVTFLLYVNCQESTTEDNNGLFPDYSNRKLLRCQYGLTNAEYICDCKNRNGLFVLQVISGNINGLIIQNCRDLSVNAGTFQDVAYIGRIQFRNIDSLSLNRYALEFRPRLPTPKIKVTFQNVNFQQLDSYSISGYIDSVIFENCQIHQFHAYAINSVYETVYNISFENTIIDWIERQAFKRLHIDYLMFKNTTFRSYLPSQTFSALTIRNEISIVGSSFIAINSQGIQLDDVNDFIFAGNQIGQLDSEALKITVNGQILIERNIFSQISHSALLGIHSGERIHQTRREIQFTSNFIHSTDIPIRFEVDRNLYLRIQDLKFAKIVDCDEAEKLRQSSFLSPYAESVYFRFGKETDKYLEFSSLSNILTIKCTVTSYIVAIVSSVAVLALIIIIVAVAIFYRFWMKHQPPQRPLNMVIPDGKTYRETQIIMQIENAGLLKTNL